MDPVLDALALHWDDVHDQLRGDDSTALDDLAGRLAAAGSRGDRLGLRLRLIDLLRSCLPPGDPVRVAIRREGERSSALDDLAQDSTLEYLGASREARLSKVDLLEAPSYSAEEVRGLGEDPGQPGLLGLPRSDGRRRLPAFQFTSAGTVPGVVKEINVLLRAATDPWGVADWWLRGNSWLGGAPAELVGVVPDRELMDAALAVRGDE